MTHEISNLKSAIVFWLILSAPVLAGLRIDLRPTPSVPPGGYQPNTEVQVDVFLVDTGNPQENLLLRGIFLDFEDSSGTFSFPGYPPWGYQFEWNATEAYAAWYHLPRPSWVYVLPAPNSFYQIMLPNEGEVNVGHLRVDVGKNGGMLDAMNLNAPDPNHGAFTVFGFGGPGDPVTTWRAFNEDITGGVLELPVVPEPASCLLIAGIFTMVVSACKHHSVVASRNQRRHGL